MNEHPKPAQRIFAFLLFFGSCTSLLRGFTKHENPKLLSIIEIAIGLLGLYVYYTKIRSKD